MSARNFRHVLERSLPVQSATLYALPMVNAAAGKTGTAGGLEHLMLEMRSDLARFILARGCDPADADDLLQDLFLKLAGLRTGPVSNPRAFLFQMSNNLLLDRRRARLRSQGRDDSWVRNRFGHDLDRDPQPTPERTVADRDELARVECALAGMPHRTAQVLRLCRVEGMPQKVIAAELGLSLSAVEKHLQRAYRALLALREEIEAGHVPGS